jgi:methionine synthase I (cobalamin-dependent)
MKKPVGTFGSRNNGLHQTRLYPAGDVVVQGGVLATNFMKSCTLARRLAQATNLPIWIKANAGTPRVVGAEVIYDTTPEQFALRAAELLEAGVSFIGGCCGTSPDFVRAIKQELGV